MDTPELSTEEACKAAGVSVSTAKRWISEGIAFPFREDANGKRRWGADAINVLERVRELRDADRSMASIRMIVGPVLDRTQSEPGPDASSTSDRTGTEPELVQLVTQAVSAAVRSETELAEKYARATFEIGQLQERVRGLETQLAARELGPVPDRSEEVERALAAVQEAAARETSLRLRLADQQAVAEKRELEVKMVDLERELADAREAIATMRPAAQPWWRFWSR